MIFPNVEKIEFGGVQSRCGLVAWNELRLFGKAVDHGENGIESVGEGEIGDEVRADVHPRHRAWLKRDGGAGGFRIASFEACAPITA